MMDQLHVRNKVQAALDKKSMRVDPKKLAVWTESLLEVLLLHYQNGSHWFQLDEILHYVTLEDIHTNVVGLNRDYEFTKELFLQHPEEAEDPRLQTPDETFGENTGSQRCPVCKGTDTVTMSRQVRCADEPTSEYVYCVCGHKWRTM
jgi:DNA-directed RNA polymerase subunit M/transcription elongation factor TFIIS